MVRGELVKGGVASIHLHGGPNAGGARWLILGEKGEIEDPWAAPGSLDQCTVLLEGDGPG
jgi:hypothetical protein